MLDPVQIEETFKRFTTNLASCAHDGIITIDLQFLHDQGILSKIQNDKDSTDDLTQYFHVIESVEKVTLFNEQFLIWIIPKMEGETPMTHVLIALNHAETPHLEVVFATYGVYNTPRYVLKILQHFLTDMVETEETLTLFEENG
jgi:hypothetical protein